MGEQEKSGFASWGAFLAAGVSVYLLLSSAYLGLASYHEMQYWDALGDAQPFPSSARLGKEAEELAHAPTPIAESMRLLARSQRDALPAIRVTPPGPRAPLAGWVHHPDFQRSVQRVEAWKKSHPASGGSAPAGAQETP